VRQAPRFPFRRQEALFPRADEMVVFIFGFGGRGKQGGGEARKDGGRDGGKRGPIGVAGECGGRLKPNGSVVFPTPLSWGGVHHCRRLKGCALGPAQCHLDWQGLVRPPARLLRCPLDYFVVPRLLRVPSPGCGGMAAAAAMELQVARSL